MVISAAVIFLFCEVVGPVLVLEAFLLPSCIASAFVTILGIVVADGVLRHRAINFCVLVLAALAFRSRTAKKVQSGRKHHSLAQPMSLLPHVTSS